jgi:signal transduction histidine kinase
MSAVDVTFPLRPFEFAPRAPSARPAPWLVGLAAAGAAGVSVALTLTSDHLESPGVQAVLTAWITVSYVFTGLIARWRRPSTPFGRLMVVAGFGMFLSSLSVSDVPLAFTGGVAFDLVAAVLFLHVFLAFPTGRLNGRIERAIVGAAYFAAFGLQLLGLGLGGFGPDNLVALVHEPAAAEALLRGQLLALSALALAGIAVLAARRRRPGAPSRRPVALLVESFGLALLMLALLYAAAALGLASGHPILETIRRATLLAIGLAPLAFLAGLLDARLARSAVGDLFVELRRDPEPAALHSALARALRDPSLTLAYWLPEHGMYADLDGRPVDLSHGSGARKATLVDRDGAPVAALIHDAALADDPGLLEAVAAAAAIALENARLHVELRARLDELKASRARIVTAGDAERRRLERNLHDGAQQRLVGVAMQLRLLQNRVREDADAAAIVTTVTEEIGQSLSELRDLARGLHPAVLEHGLAAALEALATRSAIPTTIAFDAPARLPGPVELAAYFVVCEALANVAKYSGATAATVRIGRDGERVLVEIADDGVGGADPARGTGLRGLADRLAVLDGRLRVRSPRGAGTVLTAELPIQPAGDAVAA